MLIVILNGTDIQEEISVSDLDTCINLASKIRGQNIHQQTASSKIYVTTYCIPKKIKE
tara:strand:- start:136 stop:309 length:174 start_codon:yes stop_codon:yes gene_type:complete